VLLNVFMTLAWYGHLKFKAVSLVVVVRVSWGIAFVEYCFAVPVNRIGSAVYSPIVRGLCGGLFQRAAKLGFALIALGAALE
jgi:uncharacterized protein (DUF486 family)